MDTVPDTSLEISARSLSEELELWREFALGRKDFVAGAAPAIAEESRGSALPQRLYDIYQGYQRSAVSDHTWRSLLASVRTLLSTAHFAAQWEAAKTSFPEHFRVLMRDLHPLGG